ncbi:hypothetical protein [Sphingomonas sp. MMS24-J13]|uniref:hypothetical protein n=1 Tax=Sphingomonas sp. MMS24-J13 TaxID=3238686 RepID=UPI00384DE4A0
MLGHRRMAIQVLAVLGWTLLALIALDAACGLIARPPRDPQKAGNALQVYFNYGTSIEAKLRRQLGATPGREASILKAGWLSGECATRRIEPDPRGVSIYGMSFSNHVADQLALLDPKLPIARFAGPGAPPNHSYACFLRRNEAGIDGNGTQILGILASSLRRMETLSGASTTFEQPQPFAYPRFVLRNGTLMRIDPAIDDAAGLRRLLSDHHAWTRYIADLTRSDRFASPFMANHDLVDASVLLRMVRRAWGQRELNDRTAALRGPTGRFEGAPDLVPTLQAIVTDFARRARARGQRPIVLLFEDRGYDGVLRDTMVPTLAANQIPYILSADIIPATDASVFLPDGHFRPDLDRKLAEATLPLIETPSLGSIRGHR